MSQASITYPIVQLRNDGESERNGILLAAVGDDFENAVAAVMYHARKVSASSIGSPKARQPDVVSLEGSLEPQRLEEWYDGLGYCKTLLICNVAILTPFQAHGMPLDKT